jgi:hypothetical protein
MVEMIDNGAYTDPVNGIKLFSYAHPMFWVPFSLVGDGSG